MISPSDILYWYLGTGIKKNTQNFINEDKATKSGQFVLMSYMMSEPTANFMLPISSVFGSTINNLLMTDGITKDLDAK